MHNLGALSRVCRPVTIDLWGHGHSPAPEDETLYTPDAYVEALHQVHQSLGGEPWLLCGYSIGAGLTIRYTHHHANDVIAHIFTNSSSGFADRKQVQKWQKDGPATAQKIKQNGLAAIERIAVHPKFAKRLPKDIYTALTEDAALLSPLGVSHALLHTTPNASIRDLAKVNQHPALLCNGILETRFTKAKDWAAQHMPGLEIIELNAGHAVNMEDSEGFNQAVCQFIERHTV